MSTLIRNTKTGETLSLTGAWPVGKRTVEILSYCHQAVGGCLVPFDADNDRRVRERMGEWIRLSLQADWEVIS